MLSLKGFIKLTVNDVTWHTDAEGESYWTPKNPRPGKSYYLQLPKIKDAVVKTKPFFMTLRQSTERRNNEP